MQESFAARLKEAMASKGLKQSDVIREAAVRGSRLGKSQMSQYVSGKTIPRKDVLQLLAAILEVDQESLLGHEESSVDNKSSSKSSPSSIKIDEFNQGTSKEPGAKLNKEREQKSDRTITREPNTESDKKSNVNNIGNEGSDTGMVREFKKSTKLDNVLYDVRGPVLEEAERMEMMGASILKLNIGNPAPFGFRAPGEVVFDASRQLVESEGYSAAKGLFSARKAIMQYAQIKHIPNVSIDDIYTGNGVSELINLSMLALLNNGDEVLLPSPDYPLWTACVTLAGGTPVHYICDEQAEWYPDIDDIKKKVSPRTKAIVIINPNNPTGALYPRELLEEIVEIARQNNLIIFSDEIYDRLVMDGLEHISIASMAPDLFCVTFSGLSKSHMIAGYRIGWMILSGNKALARDYILGLNMLSNMRMCSNVPAQSIVQTALGGHQSVNDYIRPGGRVYEQRDFVYEALNSIPGVSAVKPKAGFYIFPKLDTKRFNITNDEQFAFDLLHEKKILLSHGGAFNWHTPDHFRVVFLPRIEVLGDAVNKLDDFLSTYRQR